MEMLNRTDYKVLVRCMTYNQSNFIEDALNGFVMQKTDFPYLCLVMDDASTDGEQDVIRAFLDRECDMEHAEYSEIEESDIVIATHRTNLNCTFAVYFLKKNLYRTDKKNLLLAPWRECCTYEALCEGDDYWIDSEKLQKQVDVLDNNSDISLCHTCFSFHYVSEGNTVKYSNSLQSLKDKAGIAINIIDFNKYRVQTCTVMFRTQSYGCIMSECQDCFSPRFMMGDTQLWLLLLEFGTFAYISDCTSVYRICQESACRSDDTIKKMRFEISCFDMRLYMCKRLHINSPSIKHYKAEYSRLVADYFKTGHTIKVYHFLTIIDLARIVKYRLTHLSCHPV